MFFNHRRQSRDRCVVEDIEKEREGRRLWIRPFSSALFQNREGVYVSETPFYTGEKDDLCFVEDLPLTPYLDQIETITVYRWNRHYPGDVFLDISLEDGWQLVFQMEFSGHSHEKITKEVYCR